MPKGRVYSMSSQLRRARQFMVMNVLSNSASNIIQRLALSLVAPVAVTCIQVWTTLIVSLAQQLARAVMRKRAAATAAIAGAAAPGAPGVSAARATSGTATDALAARSVANRRELWHFVGAGLIGQVVGNHAFLLAAKTGGIGFTVAVAQTWGLWAIILGVLVLREKAGRRLAVGLLGALAGIVLVSAQGQGIAGFSTYLRSGLPWALVASLSWALSSVMIKRGLSRGVDQQAGLMVQYATASAVLAVTVASNPAPLAGLGLSTVAMIAGAGILSGTLAMQFLYKALSMCPISQVMLINASYPAIVNLLSWALLGESLTAAGVAGIVLITTACVWTQAEPSGAGQ